jgi:hypothetical protein
MTKPAPNGMTCWPRLDPRTGLWLCEPCWNNGDRPHHSHQGPCGCIRRGCGGYSRPLLTKPKFTRRDLEAVGQANLIDSLKAEPIRINSRS